MDYQYDVFISYSRKFLDGEWVKDIFYPLFKSYVDEALNREVKIFIDFQEIQSGNDWNLKIRNALIKSRVMVAIFSPSYFRSKWCMLEFSTINHRQKELGFLTLENPTGLIVPIKIFDGEHFPEYAKDLQIFDCIDYNRVGEGMKKTERYIELQGKLQEWIYHVATAFEKAPVFNETWMNEEWVEIPSSKVQIASIPENIKPPTL
jgi:hypothetical protein